MNNINQNNLYIIESSTSYYLLVQLKNYEILVSKS